MAHGVLPRRGYVGLTLETKPARDGGLVVRAVAPASSAERAGLEAGDRLTCIDGEPVTELPRVRDVLRAAAAGRSLTLDVERRGQRLSIRVEIIAFPLERHEGARVELGQVESGGHLLRAYAVVPEAPGPHPVVYFLPGAHWASEEYPLALDHPVPALLGALARAGYASVRVERSGVGDSQGPPCVRTDFTAELEGYRAGLAFVRAEPWVDPGRVFLFGHSLGAMVAPLLAREGAAGVACFAPSAVPISSALTGALQRYAALSASRDPGATERAPAIVELIRLVVAGGRTPAEVFAERPDLAAAAPDHFTGDSAYHRIVTFYHQLERVDVDAAWRDLPVPTLFLHGERDAICTADDALRLVELARETARFVSLPGVDHHMSDAPEGAPPKLARAVFAALRDWLGEHGNVPSEGRSA